jgi:hypothetical protein
VIAYTKPLALLSLALLALAAAVACVAFMVTTPVVPPEIVVHTYTTTDLKEVGGNGSLLAGAGFLAMAAGGLALAFGIMGFYSWPRSY